MLGQLKLMVKRYPPLARMLRPVYSRLVRLRSAAVHLPTRIANARVPSLREMAEDRAERIATAALPSMSEVAEGRAWNGRIGRSAVGRDVTMLVVSDLRIDPRVEREARALASAGFAVTVICPELHDGAGAAANLDWGTGVSIRHIHWSAASFMMKQPGYLADLLYQEAIKTKPFAFHGHDLSTAYAAMAAARFHGSHLVVDFHEWFSENVHWDADKSVWVPYQGEWKQQLQHLERRCLTEASATITVCDSIADAMETELGGTRPVVIRNIPDVSRTTSRNYPPLKQQLGLPESCFVLLWQGGTGPTRLIEPIIEALAHVPECVFVIRGPSLDLFGAGYLALAERVGVADRVKLEPPVPSGDVVAAARGADAGIWTLPALCRNFTFALPNKIFEYLAADLPVLVAHYPEAKRLVLEREVGLAFDPYDPQSIAQSIKRLMQDEPFRMRCAANTRTALAQLDAASEWRKLVALYGSLPAANSSTQALRK